MTLAIGMACQRGLVLAADTRVSYADGTVSDMEKLCSFTTPAGMFAIAQSSHDANAANSLVRNIQYAFEHQNLELSAFDTLETLIEMQMQRWYVPTHDNRPTVHLLVGMCLEGNLDRRLYFCEPPNTVTQIIGDYKAIGDGWVIADPIYNHWLQQGFPRSSPHACLCRISYLMHKAKQSMPAAIGGHTDAVVVTEKSNFPYSVGRVSMASAEAYGLALDRSIAKVCSHVMSGDSGGMQTTMKIAEGVYQMSLNYSRLEFHCSMPPNVTIDHEFCT